MLHTSHINNLGLFHGKMGISIFFYRYALHTKCKRYSDFAGEIIDEIYKEIQSDHSRDFQDGLAGICWGMEYISHNGFVKADTDEVLSDLDQVIQERDVRKIEDTSLETGLEGLGHYVIARCSNKVHHPIDCSYISELRDRMSASSSQLIIYLDDLLFKREVNYEFNLIDRVVAKSSHKSIAISDNTNLGIAGNGLAGLALKLINEMV